jgi:quinol monooxygenase YgiN
VIYVVATLMIKPETHAEFIAAATACIKETRKEPGNIAYDLHESVTDHSKMVFVEQWENAEALVPHQRRAHEDLWPRRREVSRVTAEDRSHYP